MIERVSHSILKEVIYIYSPIGGTEVIKIALSGKDRLDPDTFRVMFDVVNDAPFDGTNPKKPLQSISGSWSWFRRVRLTTGSQLVAHCMRCLIF